MRRLPFHACAGEDGACGRDLRQYETNVQKSTGELLRTNGLSQARQDRNGDFNVKVGFTGLYCDVGSNTKPVIYLGIWTASDGTVEQGA